MATPDAALSLNQWSVDEAQAWFQSQGWKRGANFVPSTASNQLEMWGGFDTDTIERELLWAAKLGYNAVRVFLHHLLYENQGDEFLNKMEQFLSMADDQGIATMFVLLDGCWDPEPVYGDQKAPRPGVHNSRWLQSPGREILKDDSKHDSLQPYVQSVLNRFGNDSRVVAWDLFNEPDNPNNHSYGFMGEDSLVPVAEDAKGREMSSEDKTAAAMRLLTKVTAWARSAGPFTNPLTVGTWTGGSQELKDFALSYMDVVSFHVYMPLLGTSQFVEELRSTTNNKNENKQRPMICSEYMARPLNSTFDPLLGYFEQHDIWAFNWGFVSGKTQTIFPWDSWFVEYDNDEPDVWFHDVLRSDGTPYKEIEAQYLVAVGEIPPPVSSSSSSSSSSSQVLALVVFILIVVIVAAFAMTVLIVRKSRRGSSSTNYGNELQQRRAVELPEIA